MTRKHRRLQALALLLVVASVAGAAGLLGWNTLRSGEIAFLPQRSPAEWIVYPSATEGTMHPRLELGTQFKRSFVLEGVPPRAELRIAGLHRYELLINGAAPGSPARPGRNWKQPDRYEAAGQLRSGENQIVVTVFNTNGPPALWLCLEATGLGLLRSDESWQASYAGATWRTARLADQPGRIAPGSPIYSAEQPWASLQASWPRLVLFGVLSAGAYWLLHRGRRRSGVLPKSSKRLKVGRAVPSAPGEGISIRTFRTSVDPRGALGTAPPTAERLEQHARQSAHSVSAREISADDRRRLPSLGSASGLDIALIVGLLGAWAVLFANNLGVLPNLAGFDATGHLPYIQYIQEQRALPTASEGWEMFQPPLYYAACAAVLGLISCSVSDDAGIRALRILGLAIGVAHFLLVWASLRLLFPGERSRPRWGLLLAACLPPLLYLSQYVSNEALGATLVSAAVYLTLRMLHTERVSWKQSAGLGLCLGAALLTKSTAVLALPVILGALALKEVESLGSRVESEGLLSKRRFLHSALRTPHSAQGMGRIGVVLAVCAVVCGWHYLRVWAQYGNPLIGVWDPRTGFSWWQDQGYRTSGYYLGFGEVLLHPWFSAFKSFGDGIYSTLWGDGLLGGAANKMGRPPWNYDLMGVGYWLALVPTAGVLTGGILALVRFLRQPAAEWFLMLGLGFLMMFAVVHMSLAVPYYCTVKAFYGLSGLIPLCALGALGLEAIGRWSRRLRPVVGILFGVWAINSYASFWIPRSSAPTLLARSAALWKEGRQAEAAGLVKAGLERKPESTELRLFLAHLLMETGELPEAANMAETAVREQPDRSSGHLVYAVILSRQQQLNQATEHARRAVELAPDDPPGYEQLASLLARQGRNEEAIQVARDGLGVAAFSPELRYALGSGLVIRGDSVEGIAQLQLARALKPTWAEPRVLLGAALAKQGRLDEAIAEYTEALRLEPDRAEALNNLAWIRAAHAEARFRDGAEAVRLAEQACRVTSYKEPMLIGTLAAAYAEAGRFEEAVTTATKARALALAGGHPELADTNQKLIDLFSARQPYREAARP